ncbi:MAG: hypothetical protein NVS2B12_05550 [Ktedonobacteraceae bacterium]
MPNNMQHTHFTSPGDMKHFYSRFKIERASFQNVVQGGVFDGDQGQAEQYTSLLLNRLLFLYFLQKKGLLDKDIEYLSNHLQLAQQNGLDTFYRSFLLPLFYEGLAAPRHPTTLSTLPMLQDRFGFVPYLGSDLFTQHAIECGACAFNIPDSAFAQLFTFFDDYHWQLDEASVNDKSITPTILGYIFEQYVNQQQMGAYYTQNDVTTYIAQNTIIPYLFDALSEQFPPAARVWPGIWRSLQESPDRYIRETIRCQRYLPTETTREYEERQHYYQALRRRLFAGEITTIDAFTTYNLDIQQFARDVLYYTNDAAFLRVCYEQLKGMTILDPTCGSGAFLFAALYVLSSLYEACLAAIDRMSASTLFVDILTELEGSPQRGSFIVRSILVNNLYGVDIMEDAIETCKLRLLLALAAQGERIDEIEPIAPQITRTIQAGNILVDLLEHKQTFDLAGPIPQSEVASYWQVMFKEILDRGGFHVIIGNPPYVKYNEETLSYMLSNFSTRSCSNLYTCVVERSRQLLSPRGRHGMILPLAAFATRNMQPFLDAFQQWFPVSWLSFYHFRPSMLFSGGKVASIATAIYLAKPQGTRQRFSTQLLKWPQEQRKFLFSRLAYCQVTAPADARNRHYYPKFGSPLENEIMGKLLTHEPVRSYLAPQATSNTMFYRSAGGLYWKVFVNFAWPYDTTSNKRCSFRAGFDRDVFVALFNSSLFWWYYTVTFDTFNLKDYMLFGFRFSYPQDPVILAALRASSALLMTDFRKHARHLKRGETGSYTIYARKSKAIIDTIDCTLARYYGFTLEELDFILNYDIKYRMSLHDNLET